MDFLIDGFRNVTWQQGVMYVIGIALIWLAIKKEYEPSLLLPMGFGAILVNLPLSGVIDQVLRAWEILPALLSGCIMWGLRRPR